MLSKEEILKRIADEMPFYLPSYFLPYIEDAMEIYANQYKWICVDSAPKDGTKIIGYDPNTEETYIVWWNKSMGYGCWNYSGNQYIPKISHWQPLPNPPKQ